MKDYVLSILLSSDRLLLSYNPRFALKVNRFFIGFKLRKWGPTALQFCNPTTLQLSNPTTLTTLQLYDPTVTLRPCNSAILFAINCYGLLTMTALQLLALSFVLNTHPQHTPQPNREHTRQPWHNEILQSARKFLN